MKRKLEIASAGAKFLCITYNTFPTDGVALVTVTGSSAGPEEAA